MSDTIAVPRLPGARVEELAASWRGRRIVVLGDVIADHYVWGVVRRMSPEAPVPVVETMTESIHLGGAANVARTLASLSVHPHLVGVVGDDAEGERFAIAASLAGISTDTLLVDATRPTTLKTRIVAHNQHVARVDRESTAPLGSAMRALLLKALGTSLEGASGLILSDYGKGVLTPAVFGAAQQAAADRGIPVFVDPKSESLLFGVPGSDTVSLNEARAAQVSGEAILDDTVEEIGWSLRTRIGCGSLLITRGPRGLCLLDEQGHAHHIGTVARKVFDVTGAGDTVVATVAAARAAGASAYEAAVIANHAAGLVVGEVGTAAPVLEALLAACASGERAHRGEHAEQGALADYFRKVLPS